MTDFETELHALGEGAARAAFEALAAVSPQATAFSSLAYAEATCAAFGYTGRIALVHDGSDVPAAGMLLFEKRRGPLRAAALPPYAEYATPLLREPLRETDVHQRKTPLDALLVLLDGAFDQLTLRLHPSLPDVRPFQWAGWRVEPAYQYEVTLHERALTSWRKSPRKTFRKHHDAFTLLDGPQHLDAVLALEADAMARNDVTTAPTSALRALTSRLAEAGLAHVFALRNNETDAVEAGMVAPFDVGTGYYWMVGSQPGPAMTVLVGHLCERLHAEGRPRLCLGGANVPSVAEFKRGFGAELVPFFRARRVTHPALRLADRLRGLS